MDEAEEPRLTEGQRYWLDQIRACEGSGKSVARYAAEQGLEARAMYGAKKVLVKKGVLPRTHRSQFQRVQTQAVSVDSEWRIRLPNGVSVEFSGTVEAGTLSTVLNTVVRLG